MKTHFYLLASLLLLTGNVESWESDYAQALHSSQTLNKPLLLFFHGSDWSGLSMKMKNEILNLDEFQKKVASDFICVEIDFPQHKELTSAVAKQNEKLKSRFKIQEFPTLLLLDKDEREITRLGYLSEEGGQLAEELIQIVKEDAELTASLKNLVPDPANLRKLYELAQELQRADAIEKVLEAGIKTEDAYFSLEKYRLLVEEGGIDSNQARALRAKLLMKSDHRIHFTIALIEFQELSSQKRDLKAAIQPLEEYIEKYGTIDRENRWRIEMMIAQFYIEADEWRYALQHAEMAYKSAPEHVLNEIEHSLNYIRTQTSLTAQGE